jgi:hypothetical protein
MKRIVLLTPQSRTASQLCGSCVRRGFHAASSAAVDPFPFQADMHPQNKAVTLNNCKPEKV